MLDRYVPQIDYPAYAFVPGRHPHPVTDARGHSFGRTAAPVPAMKADRPFASTEYLLAIDLFNAGYYWEAHEQWEGLWVAAGRTGVAGDFLKGLIKLAAAGVKSRAGQAAGVVRHARRAGELFRGVLVSVPEIQTCYAGLDLNQLIQAAGELERDPIVDASPSVGGRSVLAIQLSLTEVCG